MEIKDTIAALEEIERRMKHGTIDQASLRDSDLIVSVMKANSCRDAAMKRPGALTQVESGTARTGPTGGVLSVIRGGY